MFEEKESIWKKKGFYVSVCTAMVCLLAIGTVYYRMNRPDTEGSLWASQETSPAPESDIPENAIGDGGVTNSGIAANALVGEAEAVDNSLDYSLTEDTEEAEKEPEEEAKVAGNSAIKQDKEKNTTKTANADKKKKEKSAVENKEEKTEEVMANQLSFQEEKGLLWPVSGEVIMKYDMTGTTYFKTLAQYRCNPALIISAKEGEEVKAAAEGEILSVGKKDEIGTTVEMNIGNNYTLVYGQLKDVKVKEGDHVKEGERIASVASPSQYYAEEGANLYFQVKENADTVDPLLLLR